MVTYSWQLLRGRLPTRANLASRGVLVVDHEPLRGCRLSSTESEDHLFVKCPFACSIWYEIHKWFGFPIALPGDYLSLLQSFLLPYWGGGGCLLLVWHSVLWSMVDLEGEELIFEGSLVTVPEVVYSIKTLSWQWLLGKKRGFLLFYEWLIDPMDCIQR